MFIFRSIFLAIIISFIIASLQVSGHENLSQLDFKKSRNNLEDDSKIKIKSGETLKSLISYSGDPIPILLDVSINPEKKDFLNCSEGKDVWEVLGYWLCNAQNLSSENWTAIFTVILGFATVYLALSTQSLVRGSKATAERQLRSYVGVKVSGWNIHDNKLSVSIALFCHGSTPAKIKHVFINTEILPYPLPNNYRLAPFVDRMPQSITLFPNTPTDGGNTVSAKTYSPEELLAWEIIGGSLRWYTYGVVEYKDIFNKTRKTQFRLFVDPAGITMANGGKNLIWCPDIEGNDFT